MLRRRPRARREQLSVDEAVSILVGGHDYFHVLVGPVEENLPLLHRAWDDPEIRAAVIEKRMRTHGDNTPWGEVQFGGVQS